MNSKFESNLNFNTIGIDYQKKMRVKIIENTF